MYFEHDKQSVSFLYHLVTSKTKRVHETMICEGFWKKHKNDIWFPKPSHIHVDFDKIDKKYYYEKARRMLGTNRSMDFFMYILTDYDKGEDFILTLRRQELWLIGMLVASSSWKLEGRSSWYPKMHLHLIELDKADNSILFNYWGMNYKNNFTNLSEIRKAKNG